MKRWRATDGGVRGRGRSWAEHIVPGAALDTGRPGDAAMPATERADTIPQELPQRAVAQAPRPGDTRRWGWSGALLRLGAYGRNTFTSISAAAATPSAMLMGPPTARSPAPSTSATKSCAPPSTTSCSDRPELSDVNNQGHVDAKGPDPEGDRGLHWGHFTARGIVSPKKLMALNGVYAIDRPEVGRPSTGMVILWRPRRGGGRLRDALATKAPTREVFPAGAFESHTFGPSTVALITRRPWSRAGTLSRSRPLIARNL
jgi:hypothetical protein